MQPMKRIREKEKESSHHGERITKKIVSDLGLHPNVDGPEPLLRTNDNEAHLGASCMCHYQESALTILP